jgi:exoribonuclease R
LRDRFIQVLDDGSIEVGVHIADVSFFVRPGTALDAEAKIRSNTVYASPCFMPSFLESLRMTSSFSYMQQFAVPMLPHMLCEQLCSLNPGVDRYAFSTIFR